jgi:hypothetical protein
MPNVSPDDQRYWGYANPSLGRTITIENLVDASKAPDRAEFLRAHCNMWVAAAASWMPPGMWAKRKTDAEFQYDKTVLAVDSSVDESKYVGVLAHSVTGSKQIVAEVGFVADTMPEMWQRIEEHMTADPKLRLAITPSLDIHTPEKWHGRRLLWGYGELLKYTGLVRSMIVEGMIVHRGEQMLGEHINRAVLARANGTVVLSSQKSPGPIEMARCLVAAAAFVSKAGGTARPAMGVSK